MQTQIMTAVVFISRGDFLSLVEPAPASFSALPWIPVHLSLVYIHFKKSYQKRRKTKQKTRLGQK